MGTNWLPGMNPETMPRLCYIPKIALPTVFGDALSYMEMVNQINYHFNKAIDDINKLAENITEVVQQTVEGAKIPVYANLVHNGSHIISADNWNIDDPEAIWDGMAAGKMCILFGKLAFNVDGIPVVQNNNNMFFILTQFYQTTVNSNSTTAKAVFMSYDYNSVSYLDMQFEKNGDTVTTQVDAFTTHDLPTAEDFEAIYAMFKKNVIVYKGGVRIPRDSSEFIELTDNATTADLSEYFVVQTGGSVIAPECAPCIVLDYYNACLGELRYGGNANPWARIYGTGVRLEGDLRDTLGAINDNIVELREDIEQNSSDIEGNADDIIDLQHQIDTISTAIDDLSGEIVKYEPQTPTAQEQAIARNNIGAAPTQDPVFSGTLLLASGYGTLVNFTVTEVNDVPVLYFDPFRVQINGVVDPTSAQMVATKNYVDNTVDAVDAVKYSAQSKTLAQQEQARANIGAVGTENPYFTEAISLENTDRVLTLTVNVVDGNMIVLLDGTSVDKVLRNVADPINVNDAANKQYVDNKYVDSQNTVKYVQQSLSGTQQEQARKNISALAKQEPSAVGPATIMTSEELEYAPQLKLNSLGSDPNMDPYDETLNFSWHPYQNDGALVIVDDNGVYHPTEGGAAVDDTHYATLGQAKAVYAPFIIQINDSENGWTTSAPLPAMRVLANIINYYALYGLNLLICYPTTGITNAGYAAPKCVSIDTGVIVEAYNGSVWKRYVINADGTVTTTTL